MKQWNRSASILLAATLLIGLLALLPASNLLAKAQPQALQDSTTETTTETSTAVQAPSPLPDVTVQAGPSGPEDWISTPGAQVRDSQGVCAEGYECLELCVNGEPTGTYQCWPNNSW